MPQVDTQTIETPLIHIGFPKAASTWLQKYLFQPDQGYIKIMNPIDAQLNLIDPPALSFEPQTVHAFLRKQIKQRDPQERSIPVITSEALSGKPYGGGYNRKELADRLKTIFPQARVLIIVREQKSMILSLFKLVVNWGLPHSLAQFLNPIDPRIAPQFNYDYLCYDKVVAYYQLLYGKKNVLVLPFEQFKMDPASFIGALKYFSPHQDKLPKNATPLPYDAKVNISPPITHLILRHWINYYLLKTPFNYSGPITNQKGFLFRCIKYSLGIQKFLPDAVNRHIKDKYKSYIKTQTLGKFGESNRALEKLIQTDLSQYGYDV